MMQVNFLPVSDFRPMILQQFPVDRPAGGHLFPCNNHESILPMRG